MPRSLYSPKLSDDVVRALYREGQHRRMPMTRLADELLRQSISRFGNDSPVPSLHEEEPTTVPYRNGCWNSCACIPDLPSVPRLGRRLASWPSPFP